MAKSKYEKMEIMLEEIMKETDIEAKIAEMKKDIEEGPKGEGKSKEEYRRSMQEDKKRKDELGKKLKFYEGFKNNKDQILNIREYQLSLQVKLDKLEKEKGIVEKIAKNSENLNDDLEKIDKELEGIMQEREKIAQKLKNNDLSKEDREKLLKEDRKLVKDIDMNSQKYQVIQNFNGDNTNSEYRNIEEISKEILNTQIKISKCNMIWSSLLKGKDWNQIEVILNTGDFTAKKGTIDRIKNLKEASEIKTDKKNSIKNVLKNTSTVKNNENEASEVKTNLPEIVKPSFKERHPRLARIPFLARIIDGFNKNKINSNDKADDKKDDRSGVNTNTDSKNVKNLNLDDEKALNYIEKRMEQNEVAMFKSIAKNGFKESMKIDLKQRRDEAKKVAVEREAQKLHGRYDNNNGR